MADQRHQSSSELWRLARRQHGVVTRRQLLDLGLSPVAIKHRIARGRLHAVHRGVYAVGRPQLDPHGRWTAAVLSCGPKGVLSHSSAAALWEIGAERGGRIEISVLSATIRRRRGLVVHRRPALDVRHVTSRHGIRITTPLRTLIDMAVRLDRPALETSINEADKRGLIDPDELSSALGSVVGQPGVALLRETLDHRTFTLTDSELERRFLPLAREVGLPKPRTRYRVNGFRVDFYWPHLGLVVETDGLRYHRTPAAQARDRLRDQAHAAAGLTPLRFTHSQVYFEPAHVRATLAAVAAQLPGVRRDE